MAIRPGKVRRREVELCGPVAHEFAPDRGNLAGNRRVATEICVTGLPGGIADPAGVVADFHIGDLASVWKPTPTFGRDG